MKVKEMAGNAADDLEETTQFKANTTSSLTTLQVDAVKEVGCSLTETLNPKKKLTQLKSLVSGESSDVEDRGKVGINHANITEGGNSEQGHQKGTASNDRAPYIM